MHLDSKADPGFISETDRILVNLAISNHPHMKKYAKALWHFIEIDSKKTYERGKAHPWGGLSIIELIIAYGADQKVSQKEAKFIVKTEPKLSSWGKDVRKIPFTEPLFSQKKSKDKNGIEIIEDWDNPLSIGQGGLGDCALISTEIAILSNEHGDQVFHSMMRDLSEYIDDEKTITLAEALGEQPNIVAMRFILPESSPEIKYAVAPKETFSGKKHVLGPAWVQMLEIGFAVVYRQGNMKKLDEGISEKTALSAFLSGASQIKHIHLSSQELAKMREEKTTQLAALATLKDSDPKLQITLASVFDKDEKLIKEFLQYKKPLAAELEDKDLEPITIVKAMLYFFHDKSLAIKCFLEYQINLLASDKRFSKEYEKLTFEKISELIKTGAPIVFGIGKISGEEKARAHSNEIKKDGLVGMHCYAATGVGYLNFDKAPSKPAVQLFNPWGHPEINGEPRDGYGRTHDTDFGKDSLDSKSATKASLNSISWFLWEDLLKNSIDVYYYPRSITEQTTQELSAYSIAHVCSSLVQPITSMPVKKPSPKTSFFSFKTTVKEKTSGVSVEPSASSERSLNPSPMLG